MLALNTAFMTANIALEISGKKAFRDIDAKSKHSENVLKTVDEMCQELGNNINQIEVLAVVVGPGSFTGLRIGTAIAQALGCTNKNLKFVAISSLELMAYIIVKNQLCKNDFVCVLNALSNQFFVCKFDKNGIKLSQEQMIDRSMLDALNCPKFALKNDLDEFDCIEINSELLLEFANCKAEKGEFATQEQMLPVYLRLSQAEDNLLKKTKKDL